MANDHILPFLDFLQKEMLLFASLSFLVGSVDDLLFDGLWIFHSLRRKLLVYSRYQKATVESLSPAESGNRCNASTLLAAMDSADLSHLCRLLSQ